MFFEILGTTYKIERKRFEEEDVFERISGYCCSFCKKIVTCDLSTDPKYKIATAEELANAEKETLRHEIIHAFFNESGLKGNANDYEGSWVENEEMVDWIALQFPKMNRVFKEVGCL